MKVTLLSPVLATLAYITVTISLNKKNLWMGSLILRLGFRFSRKAP